MGTSFGDASKDILAMNIDRSLSMQLSVSYNKLRAARFALARNLGAYDEGDLLNAIPKGSRSLNQVM